MDARQLKQVAAMRRRFESGEAREGRLAARVTLAEMAAAAGIPPSTLWRYENGQRRPRPAQALALARVYARVTL